MIESGFSEHSILDSPPLSKEKAMTSGCKTLSSGSSTVIHNSKPFITVSTGCTNFPLFPKSLALPLTSPKPPRLLCLFCISTRMNLLSAFESPRLPSPQKNDGWERSLLDTSVQLPMGRRCSWNKVQDSANTCAALSDPPNTAGKKHPRTLPFILCKLHRRGRAR